MKRRMILALAFVLAVFFFTGCAATQRVMDYSDLKTNVAMSGPVFLSPTNAEKTVYLQVKNTSSNQLITNILCSAIQADLQYKGYRLVNDPSQASYILQPIITYCGAWKEGGIGEGVMAGAAAGALGGIGLSRSYHHALGRGVGLGLLGAAVGLAADLATRVQVYVIMTDFQITEMLGNKDLAGIRTMETKRTVSKSIKGGMGAKPDPMTREAVTSSVTSDREGVNVIRSGVAAKAAQIGLDPAQAAQILTEISARQIAGIF